MKFLRGMSLQSKLLATIVLITLASILTVSWLGFLSARAGLKDAAERQLLGLQRSKATAVETALTKTTNEMLGFSALPSVTEGATQLLDAFRKLDSAQINLGTRDAVEKYYETEVGPALKRHSNVSAARGALLPTNNAGWYLHFHYLVENARPYTGSGELKSSTDDSEYGRLLAQWRPRLGGTINRLGFDNILLIDPITLEVFFSYQASTVLGTSLIDGPYAASNLATVAKKLRESQEVDEYEIADFEAYRPALGAPRAFLMTPVFDGNRMVAIMALRLPIEPIENALTGNRDWKAEGLGKTGESYLVGPDHLMRSNSRFILEDPKAFVKAMRGSPVSDRTVDTIELQQTTILTLPVQHQSVLKALNGESGIVQTEDYRGMPVYSAFGPIDFGSVRWALISEMDRSEAMQPLRDYARKAIIAAVGLGLLASLLALWLASALTRPITDLVRGARRVSSGELDVEVPTAHSREYRVLGDAFNDMVRSLRDSRAQLARQVDETERLLQSLLPASGAAQVKEGRQDAPQSFADVTVAFVNLFGIDSLSNELGDEASLSLLSEIVAAFDEAAETFGVEKVRTIGSSYLAASGLSIERPDHTARMVDFAREVVRIVRRFNSARGLGLVAEIGINTGPVTGGIVGRRRFIYDLWGDTVKLVKGLATDGETSIQVTRAVYDRVRDTVPFGPAFTVEIRGMGAVELHSVLDEAAG